MATEEHRLLFYKTLESHGSTVTLNIYEKTALYPRATRIGRVLTSLSYGIQSRETSVDEPIQKTSLEFSLIDAPERNTPNERWGNWESFYTSDATGYKVELVVDDVVRWTGYITPDSWEEDLSYHAPVTITARDNWGRLQEFDFDAEGDAEGLITVWNLVKQAAAKCELAMDVQLNTKAAWPICQGAAIYAHLVNVRAFEGKTWWDALYDTLASLGLCLTYEDNNTFVLAPLRARVQKGYQYMPDVPKTPVKFVHAGHRSLAPAVKEIREVQQYEFSKDMINAPELTLADFDAGGTYPFTSQPYGVTEKRMPVHSLAPGRFWKQNESGYYSLFCQLDYKPRANDDAVRLTDGKTLFLACNPGTAADYATAPNSMRGVYFTTNMTKMRATLHFKTGEPVRLYGSAYNTGTAKYSEQYTSPAFGRVVAVISYTTVQGQLHYFNGTKWVQGDSAELVNLMPGIGEDATSTYEFEIPSADIDKPGTLRVEFRCGVYIIRGEWEQTEDGQGMYMPITDLALKSVWEVEAENKVNTIYNEGNNVTLTRRPEIGCVNFDTCSPQEVLNGVYSPTTGRPASREWRWSDDNATTYQLPVLLHKQLLAYHSKPNSVLTGALIVDDLRALPSFGGLWMWKGKEHLLMSGRINLLSGQLEGAELREFVRYGDMWQAHVNIDYFEVGFEGGDLAVRVIANSDTAWEVDTPAWITPSATEGKGTADIVLTAASGMTDRAGYVKIGPAVVKVVQGSKGDFSADYNEDFKHFRDFNEDYDRADMN